MLVLVGMRDRGEVVRRSRESRYPRAAGEQMQRRWSNNMALACEAEAEATPILGADRGPVNEWPVASSEQAVPGCAASPCAAANLILLRTAIRGKCNRFRE